MADRLIDRYFPQFPESAKNAFLRMAGNFQQNVSENLLKAWSHELDDVDPACFELAVKRVMKAEHIVHFPRWAEFCKYLPELKGEIQGQQAWYDAYTGTWGGPWPVPGARLTSGQMASLGEVRSACRKIHAGQNGKPWDCYGEARSKLLAMLDDLIGDGGISQLDLDMGTLLKRQHAKD